MDRSGPTSVTELATAEQITRAVDGTTLTARRARGLIERLPIRRRAAVPFFSITKSGTRVLGDKHTARAEHWQRPFDRV